MSRITKMKYVAAETTLDFFFPTENQTICKILKPLGNNLHMVVTPSGEEFIASMPPKFRKHIYVRRGSYVVTEPIVEGKKVKAEIVRILLRDQIKYFSENGAWPEAFSVNCYLDNQYHNTDSDRGFVHGNSVYWLDREKATKDEGPSPATPAADGGDPEGSYSESDDESDLVPNYNRKAVSRIVFEDDESDDDSDEDDESDVDEDSDKEGDSNADKSETRGSGTNDDKDTPGKK